MIPNDKRQHLAYLARRAIKDLDRLITITKPTETNDNAKDERHADYIKMRNALYDAFINDGLTPEELKARRRKP